MKYTNQDGGLVFRRDSFGEKATMWCKPTKKNGVFKYTVVKGNNTFTYLIDLNKGPVSTKTGERYPVTILKGNISSKVSVF